MARGGRRARGRLWAGLYVAVFSSGEEGEDESASPDGGEPIDDENDGGRT